VLGLVIASCASTSDLQVKENPASNDFHIKLDANSLLLI
jgi:hypothetical protein